MHARVHQRDLDSSRPDRGTELDSNHGRENAHGTVRKVQERFEKVRKAERLGTMNGQER